MSLQICPSYFCDNLSQFHNNELVLMGFRNLKGLHL